MNLCVSRPTHCYRYAFTPLIDDSDDEEIEEFLVSANIGEQQSVHNFMGASRFSSMLCAL